MTSIDPAGAGRSLDGRVVVVTGGNGGIGLGIARSCGRRGAAISVWGRSGDKNSAAVSHLTDLGITAASTVVDVTDESAVVRALADDVEHFGRIDTMIANAGAGFPAPTLDLTLDRWRRALDVNLTGAFITCRAAARQMVDNGEGGAIVAVSSTSARHGAAGNIGYGAAKAGVESMMRGFAVEFARHRIRVNTLMPGWTDTDMTAGLKTWQAFVDATTARTPVRRWGTPDELGEAAAFLADPALLFHTGDTIVVDGGYTVF